MPRDHHTKIRAALAHSRHVARTEFSCRDRLETRVRPGNVVSTTYPSIQMEDIAMYGSTTIEKWKLDIRWTYVFEHNTGPYLAVQDDFGNLVEVDPDFKILEV